jgi:hypothetical protein
MIRNNSRDPNAKSIWLQNNNNDYNIGINSGDCYSNLCIYGTNYGTNSTHYYSSQIQNLDGGIVKPIISPYPVEPIPEIILKLGQPHTYDSGYNKSNHNLGFEPGYDLSSCNSKNNLSESEYLSSNNSNNCGCGWIIK